MNAEVLVLRAAVFRAATEVDFLVDPVIFLVAERPEVIFLAAAPLEVNFQVAQADAVACKNARLIATNITLILLVALLGEEAVMEGAAILVLLVPIRFHPPLSNTSSLRKFLTIFSLPACPAREDLHTKYR